MAAKTKARKKVAKTAVKTAARKVGADPWSDVGHGSHLHIGNFLTFVGILWWTFIRHKDRDFAAAAQLPFADDDAVATPSAGNREEQRHV